MISSLSFDSQNLSHSTLGLGVLLIIFLLSSFIFLHIMKLNFMPLGHVGYQYRQLKDSDSENGAKKVPSLAEVEDGKKHSAVATAEKDTDGQGIEL